MNIKQNDHKLKLEIQKFGCYLLCLHYYISKFKKLEFTVYDINDNYHKFINVESINSSSSEVFNTLICSNKYNISFISTFIAKKFLPTKILFLLILTIPYDTRSL